MKRTIRDRGRRDALKTIAMLAATPIVAEAAQAAPPRPVPGVDGTRLQAFDADWRFYRGDAPGAETPAFDDGSWRHLSLPHDWSVEDLPERRADTTGESTVWGTTILPTRVGAFDTELSRGGRDTGWFVGGTGWYRKRFSAAALPAGRRVEIVFDGVYMNSDVWLNGHLLGTHPYGYTAFAYDLTPHLARTGENVLAVRVRNEGRNSRWYSGSGIYRHVWLQVTGELRVPLWGVFVTTPEVSPERATVNVAVSVTNDGTSRTEITTRVRMVDDQSKDVASAEARCPVAAGGTAAVEAQLQVASPRLWAPSTPRLYRADIDILSAGVVVDHVTTTFGIRRVEVDADHGLRINGEPVKLKGACLHHDNGLLGACAIDRAEERRVELMKAHGFNAIRTSHNPPSPAFLDACDRLGMLVMDEAFDQWEQAKNPEDYHLSFAEWWTRDIDAMVLRDRNHPSVILWSIGNEIPERAKPRGVEIARSLAARIKLHDSTRPVTAAINGERGLEDLDPAFQHLDVGGYNYLDHAYVLDHARQPRRVMVGTESFPLRAFQSWDPVERFPYVIGDFVWTGMDHLGESGIGNAQLSPPPRPFGGPPPAAPPAAPAHDDGRFTWPMAGANIFLPFPWFNCFCGDIDLIGQPKPQWFYRSVLWGISPVEMAVSRPVPDKQAEVLSWWGWSDELRSWTWPGQDGKPLKVRVYTRGDDVQLSLNGRVVATKPVAPAARLIVEFELPYEPGELKVVARKAGQVIGERVLKTTGAPAALLLTADRPAIRRGPGDLAYVTATVVDADGRAVPDAVVPVRFAVSGAGALVTAGSANPKDVGSFRTAAPKTFHGQALAIVRPRGAAGLITIRADAPGLKSASVTVRVA